MSVHEPNGTLAWRVGNVERRLDRLDSLEPAVVAQRVNDLHDDITDLRNEIKGVRRALWGFGLSIAGSAILFAITALQTFH